MEILSTISNYIIGVIREPAFFLGLVACLGLVLQKKPMSDIISGTLKSIIGVLVLFAGVDIVVNSLGPIAFAFEKLFSIQSEKPLADFGTFMDSYGAQIGIVMLLGFLLNVLIARFTPFKTIFLTGNLIYWFAMLFVSVGVENGLTGVSLIIFALIFQVAYLVIVPWIVRPLVKNLTGDDTFTIGHTAAIFCIIGDLIGRVVKTNTNAEDLKLPKALTFFRETTVTSGIVLFVVYFGALFILKFIDSGTDTGSMYNVVLAEKGLLGKDIFTISLKHGMQFAAGVIVILAGSRMMLSEIVPAFKGIADKLVPNSVPALDIPLVFPFGPNSLLIGFVTALFSSILAITAFAWIGIFSFAVIPMTVACYFDVAPGAIFANKRGGVLAAILSSIVGGFLMIALVAFALPLAANTTGTFVQAWGGNDFSLWVIIADFFASLFN